MWLTQTKTAPVLLLVLYFLFNCLSGYSTPDKAGFSKNKDKGVYTQLFTKSNFNNGEYKLAIIGNENSSKKENIDSILVYKKWAFQYTESNEPELACEYIEKYIKASLDVSFITHSYFDTINGSKTYKTLVNKYIKKVDMWSIICLYIGFIGVFIAIVLNLKKRSDRIANLLISIFVFQHSLFIIHVSLLLTNYEYYLPHTLYISTLFSYLYGPLIYFYFKRITTGYLFRSLDILHLLPTILLVIFLLPIYNLPEEEKLRILLNDQRPYITIISDAKLISLCIYTFLVIRVYVNSIMRNKNIPKVKRNWQKTIVVLSVIYILSYFLYDVLLIRRIIDGFPVHLHIITTGLLVLYISYMAFVQPFVFEGSIVIMRRVEYSLNKYKKSGLTKLLSLELKEKLLYLLDHEKIYRKNDISLQKLSELLNTSRHNTSQIINEHFNLNFFELINMYRIEEAKQLLKAENNKKVNIIDVAYEVGFNNKVTFNKSFKKYNQVTPSEYLKMLIS